MLNERDDQPRPARAGEDLIKVKDLKVHFPTGGGTRRAPEVVHAVDGVSMAIAPGETLALVGESGCGKSTIARALIRLLQPTAGTIIFAGQDITRVAERALRPIRAEMQMVFQDPASSLSPRMRVETILSEPMRLAKWNRDDIHRRVRELLEFVGLNETAVARYPHEFSGGQKQRIAIARALALSPKLIICDEPVSALDVSVQAQVINLLKDIQKQFGVSYLFVSHDLGVVRNVAHRVAVMYLGKKVEEAPRANLYERPMHPYTQALLSAVPRPRVHNRVKRVVLKGDLPSPVSPPAGCRFHTRCPLAADVCRQTEPPLREIESRHSVACHFAGQSIAG
ncbi:ABC transporter ATP-binding protein [Aquamicrobium ahrensii]|uniref:Peptide/nickel transport system ATP-binding protein/oligopeptide transport system ATP-binding protein n=1 Tax=Aquamicrobium ahrensii TaxID=469551 RepID=A0ABV2KQI4_9HYPH